MHDLCVALGHLSLAEANRCSDAESEQGWIDAAEHMLSAATLIDEVLAQDDRAKPRTIAQAIEAGSFVP